MIFKCVLLEGHCGHHVVNGLDESKHGGRGTNQEAIQVSHDDGTRAEGIGGQIWKCVDIW